MSASLLDATKGTSFYNGNLQIGVTYCTYRFNADGCTDQIFGATQPCGCGGQSTTLGGVTYKTACCCSPPNREALSTCSGVHADILHYGGPCAASRRRRRTLCSWISMCMYDAAVIRASSS